MQACLTMLLYLIDMTNPKFDSIQRQFRIRDDSMLMPFLNLKIILRDSYYEWIRIYTPVVVDKRHFKAHGLLERTHLARNERLQQMLVWCEAYSVPTEWIALHF